MSVGQSSVNVANYLIRTTNLPAWGTATVCGWAQLKAFGASGTYSCIATLNHTSTGYDGIYRDNTTGKLVLYESSIGFGATDLGAVTTNDWIFWALTQGSGIVTGYAQINAGSMASVTQTLPAQTMQDIRLSRDQGGAGNGSGSFYDHVRVWGATLNSTELAAERTAASAVRSTNLLTDSPLPNTSTLNGWSITGSLSNGSDSPYISSGTRPVRMAGRWGGFAGPSGGFAG